MASYSAPSQQDIADTTGVNFQALGLDRRGLSGLLTKLVSRAEADVAQQVSDATFDSSALTARQVTTLQEAVSYAVAWRYLRVCQARLTSGTYEAVLPEGSADMGAVIAAWQEQVRELSETVLASGEGTVDQQYKTGFADSDTPTFTRAMEW